MDSLLFPVWFIPVAFWVASFWFRLGCWVYLHGRAAYQRVLRFKDAAMAAYQGQD